MTEMLFYQDPYLQHCSARVLSISQRKESFAVLCDRSLFYPEGGGQPADRGLIGGYPIADVQREGEEVVHILDKKPAFSPGEVISMELDWEHRYDYMQQHTGQHIISGVMYRECGIGTVAVHQGDEYTTIETDRSELDEEELDCIAKKAQEIIGANLPVEPAEIDDQDKEIHQLRREPKVSGIVRVIRLGVYDRAACGGLHVKRTGETLLVMCIGTEKIRGRIRTVWKIGDRALHDYRQKHAVLERIGTLLSTPGPEADQRVEKMINDMKQLQYEKNELRRSLARRIIETVFSQAEPIGGVALAVGKTEIEDPEVIKEAGGLIDYPAPFVFCLLGDSGSDIRWVITASESLELPFREIQQQLLPLIDGKGGGKPPLWQGIGRDPSGAEAFMNSLREWAAQWIRRQRTADGERKQ